MFDSLFGSEPSVIKFVIAFVVVIALIAVAAWLVRRFGAARLGNGATRGRQPRLAVIDAASVDGRRRLVLIRRDNIEHLLMIGGPTDVVIEPNIVRATTRDTSRMATAESTGRSQPADIATSWPLQPSVEPAVAATPARHLRATFGDETHWNGNDASHESAPEPAREPSRVRPDSLTGMATGLAADLSARLNPPVEPSFGRQAPPEPPHMAPPAAPPVEPARRYVPESDFDSRRSDRNLAEMASRLEAALRRPPPLPEGRPPVTDARALAPEPKALAPEPKAPAPKIPAAEPRASEVKPPLFAAAPKAKVPDIKAPDVKAPEAAAPQVAAPQAAAPQVATPHVKAPDIKASELKAPDIKPAAAPSVAPERLPTADSKTAAPAPAAKAASKPASQPASKSIYDNLEQEMASLLGRPANK